MSDLNELMSRDPTQCTREDIWEIVRIFREQRAQFELGNMRAGTNKKPKKAGAEEAPKVKPKLDLRQLLEGK